MMGAGSLRSERGSAVVELAFMMPMLLVLLLGCADVCLLLERQVRLIHLGREAANVYSRGSTATETLAAVVLADGNLNLDGSTGRVILTRVERDQNGNPVIVEQEKRGSLPANSSVGTMGPGGNPVPAHLPNGGSMPPYSSLVVVEMFSQQLTRFPAPGIWDDTGPLVLRSLAVF
jgi:hypothetical protein